MWKNSFRAWKLNFSAVIVFQRFVLYAVEVSGQYPNHNDKKWDENGGRVIRMRMAVNRHPMTTKKMIAVVHRSVHTSSVRLTLSDYVRHSKRHPSRTRNACNAQRCQTERPNSNRPTSNTITHCGCASSVERTHAVDRLTNMRWHIFKYLIPIYIRWPWIRQRKWPLTTVQCSRSDCIIAIQFSFSASKSGATIVMRL